MSVLCPSSNTFDFTSDVAVGTCRSWPCAFHRRVAPALQHSSVTPATVLFTRNLSSVRKTLQNRINWMKKLVCFSDFFCAFFSCWFGILHVPKHFWKQDLGLVKEIGQVAYTETNYQSRGCDSAQIFSHPIGWWRRARGHGKSLKLREVDRLSTDAKAMVMKPSRHWSNISYCRFTRLRWLHHHSPST